jgi:hypothetical protein
MSDLTQKDIVEIEKFTNTAHEKYTGLIMDSTIQGRANSNSVAAYVLGRGLPLTMENLDAAVVALQFVLFWTAGNEPGAVPSDNRTRAQKAHDGGIKNYEPTHYNDAANGVESIWAKNIRLEKEAKAQKDAAKEKANRRFKETNQVVQNKVNGGIDYAASNALNEEARRRHAAEDAQASGKPVRVTGFRVIPDNETNFRGPAEAPYTPAELSAYLARRKGGHLLR